MDIELYLFGQLSGIATYSDICSVISNYIQIFFGHIYSIWLSLVYCSAVYERQMGGRGNNPAEPNLFLWSKEDGGLPHMALVTCHDTGEEPPTHL